LLITILTKNGGLILGPIASLLGLIMNAIYEFFHFFGIQNIALTIFVFTFITKTLMLPLTIKQQKFTKLSSRMNPEIQKIQAKYKGKKDEASLRKQQEETQAVYRKYGASPTAGCLPLLISLPIMFALFQVINNIPAYVNQVKDLYESVALQVASVPQYKDTLTTLAEGVSRYRLTEFPDTNSIIDLLSKFSSDKWEAFRTSFPTILNNVVNSGSNGATIAAQIDSIQNVNTFFGLNITNNPGWKFPGILIPIFAMGLQFIQGKQMQVKNTSNDNNSAAAMTNSMNVVMPIMSGVFCVTLPTGVGLYWIATSIFAIIQQFFVNKYLDRVNVDDLIEKNIEKASKKVSPNKGNGTSLQELARKQTKNIESKVVAENDYVEASEDKSNDEDTSSAPKSISDIANLLKNRNVDKGDK
jgi:YidC/Oxa1 family membrane protein insertase